MSTFRTYDLRRRSGETVSEAKTFYLCERHFEARKIIGWEVERESDQLFGGWCQDCSSPQSTVMDRAIEAEDARDDEPVPPPVSDKQRSLF